jgi:hypothetical protein
VQRDRDQVGDDFIERSAGIHMRAALPEERLDPGEVIQDHRSFQESLPVVVRRSAFDPVKDHVSRGAEQDDRVETVIELRLVPRAPFNEKRATIIGVQQPGDPFLDPEPLPAMQLVGGLNILAILACARCAGMSLEPMPTRVPQRGVLSPELRKGPDLAAQQQDLGNEEADLQDVIRGSNHASRKATLREVQATA